MKICTVKKRDLHTGQEHTMIEFIGMGDLLAEAQKRVRAKCGYANDEDAIVFRTIDDRSFALAFEGSAVPKSIITILIYNIEVL